MCACVYIHTYSLESREEHQTHTAWRPRVDELGFGASGFRFRVSDLGF